MKTVFLTLATVGLVASMPAQAVDVASTFDDLSLDAESHFFPETPTTFTSGLATFNHDYTEWFEGCCHSAWVYSSRTDTTTAGYTNQHAAYTGGGAQGSDNYAIAFFGTPTVSFDGEVAAVGTYLTNTTYAALSMLSGDSFAKKFGGDDGTDPDYFKLSIIGLDSVGNETGTVDFFLADYRFEDSASDYLVDEWTWVDLSSLGTVNSLAFSLESSDTGSFGINTPAYFAMDNLTVSAVPEPGQALMLLAGLSVVAGAARRRRRG